jgi:hypothetical protein
MADEPGERAPHERLVIDNHDSPFDCFSHE